MVRTEKHIGTDARKKIALFCNVEEDCVVEAKDVRDIYEIPLMLKNNGLDKIVLKKLRLKPEKTVSPMMKKWKNIVDIRKNAQKPVRIGVVGKYITLQDAYKSIDEALYHGAIANKVELDLVKIEADNLEKKTKKELDDIFDGVNGILIPGGFGGRGIEGKLVASKYARENNIPFLGICLGMQIAVIEFARNVCKMKGANSTEFKKRTKYPVISLLTEQKKIKYMGGTMRLGQYKCKLKPGTIARKAYGSPEVMERHRHRYEFNGKYKEIFKKKGMILSGIHPKGQLVEIVELKGHPFYIAAQFHPEFKSKPDRPHPIFTGFIKASKEYR